MRAFLYLHAIHTPFSTLYLELAIWHVVLQANPGLQQGKSIFNSVSFGIIMQSS